MAARGQTAQLSQMYAADFESGDAWERVGDEVPDQRVWLSGLVNLQTLEVETWPNLDDFMTFALDRGDNNNREIAFHNLKFDGSFIVPWLFRNGWKATKDKPQPGEFSALVDERNNWYSIKVQVNKKRHVLFWDTLKLWPMKLEYLPRVYHTPTQKVKEPQEFYEKFRPEGYVPDERDMEYFIPDLMVVAETLIEHIKREGLRFKKTQASQAFANFEEFFPAWKRRCPPLSVELDELIRPAYVGGMAYVPPTYAGIDHYDIGVFDINQSYPYQWASKPMPYGVPEIENNPTAPKMNKFWVAELHAIFRVKEWHMPCVSMKQIVQGKPISSDKWVHDSEGVVKLRISSVDYATIAECYDFEVIKWIWVVYWPQKVHKEIRAFVEHNFKIRTESKQQAKVATDLETIQELLITADGAKKNNNSSYGKMGEEIVKKGKTPHDLGKHKAVRWVVDREDIQTEYKRKFLPMAIAITAYGRQQLCRFGNILGKYFLYSDTDSVHYLRKGQLRITQAQRSKTIEVGSKLGGWKYEGTYVRGRYLRPKAYMEQREDGTVEVTLAGLPADPHTGMGSKQRSCITWDNFHIGYEVPAHVSNKFRTIRTPTGDKIVPTAFRIRPTDFF